MRPILKPGLRRLWHNSSTLQLGIDPARAVLVTDLGPPHAALLDALDGRRTLEQLRLDGGEAARDLLDLLGRAGLLDDAATAPGTTPLSPADRDRLSPDLAALSIRSADPARPRRVLAARRAARVLVRGAGRVGAQISTLLAAAGVGRVVVDDAEVTTAADVSPGGLRLDDVGRPRALAAGTAMTRVRRQADRRPGLGAAGSASLPPPGAATDRGWMPSTRI
ncbi:ThiF family adenylyltransferase [Frankia sp. ArI3]|uniref:ThiF family adenylyltransferase n=1 Tax=Frankia sp. ArI3 TaxID=1858 RepID=UPI0021050CCF|nr:ThiF family adenylyltransferase [Frankia sp. ArI3]